MGEVRAGRRISTATLSLVSDDAEDAEEDAEAEDAEEDAEAEEEEEDAEAEAACVSLGVDHHHVPDTREYKTRG